MDVNKLITLIKEGENERIEFKTRAQKDIAKEICALTNANGGYILVGVNDEGKIVGCDPKRDLEVISSTVQAITPPVKIKTKIVEVGDKNVLVVEVPKSETLCSIGGVAYIRIGSGIRPLSIQEVLMLSSELGVLTWDEFPALELSEMVDEYVKWFFSSMEKARGRKIKREDWLRYLRSAKAIKGDKLTNTGVLFFTNAQNYIPHSGCRIVKIVNDEPVWSKEFTGPVWKIIDEVFTELMEHFKTLEVVVGIKRMKLPEYPPRAVREALINAFAHRNYAIPSDIRIFIHPNKLVIRNPGGLMPGVDLNDPEHVPRNPNLCQLFYDVGYIEKYGYGIRMIREECKRHGLVSVDFKSSPNRFEVVFKKRTEELLDNVDRKILQLLVIPRRSGEISEAIGLSKPAVVERLKKLESLGLIRKTGRGAHVKYVVRK